MRKDDFFRIRHILDSTKEAVAFGRGQTREDLEKDRMRTLSIVKSIEIIGEAASKVSKKTWNKHPEIPWPDIVATRNRLIHVYFDIDLDRVLDTVIDDLPPLLAALEKIVLSPEKRKS
jgi:uncharacterized protein with HEPN domain